MVRARAEDEVRDRLAADSWHQNGMLAVTSIRSWRVLLDGLGVDR